MADKFHTHRLILAESAAGQRLDQALAAALPAHSRARLQQAVRDGGVTLDGLPARRCSQRVAGGETVAVQLPQRDVGELVAQALPLDIVHADDSVLVVNKPAGLVVHPGAGNRERTLVNALLAHDGALAALPRCGLVHRLDKDTTGLLIVARTASAHVRLVAALQAREIQRHYLALCVGLVPGSGSIDRAIGRHRSQRTRMAVRSDGRAARTHYAVREQFRAHTLLQVRLETGRTHQIRVHLAHLGFPVFGDQTYGGGFRPLPGATAHVQEVLAAFRRQALHAEQLQFAHPVSGRTLRLRAPLPADFRQVLTALRADRRRAGSRAAE